MSFIAALGSGFFSRLCVWFSTGIPKVDERVMKVFIAVYGYLRQLLYFGWGANDLRVAKVEQNEKSRLDRLMAGYMLLISGVIGIVHESLCLLSKPPVWKVLLISSGSFFFFLSSCLYLQRNIEKFSNAQESRIKISAVIGITASIAYLGVSFLGIFGIQALALSIICALATVSGIVQLLLG